MQPIQDFTKPIDVLFSDIDDTMTSDGKLPSESYEMLWKLADAGIKVIPVTGRPAGWCEMISRFWPVAAVIGENGAFYFEYKNKKMQRFFAIEEKQRIENQKKLEIIKTEILDSVIGAALASDQFTRLFDLAIDFCEDVEPLNKKEVEKIVAIFEKHGATAKVSSIHVNGWFGQYNKKSMCEIYYSNSTGKELNKHLDHCAFIGDSPNDEPLFEFFKNSFAVANILDFKKDLKHLPNYVTIHKGASGFVEMGNVILKNINS
jgi:HAD superfamily hydrolase (TIGR01484 family)